MRQTRIGKRGVVRLPPGRESTKKERPGHEEELREGNRGFSVVEDRFCRGPKKQSNGLLEVEKG